MGNIRLLLFTLAFLPLAINAQTDYRPGYIIFNSGDTLIGEIDYRGDLLMGRECRFVSNNNEVTYLPDEIRAFRFLDSKYFISKEFEGKFSFFEYLIDGELDIFYLRDGEGDHYFIEKLGEPLSELTFEEGIRYENERDEFFSTKTHIGILTYYMQDAPTLKREIESIKKPDHINLVKVAEKYHEMVCVDQQCIVYEKRLPLLSVAIEPNIGIKMFDLSLLEFTEIEHDTYFRELGLDLNFWAPRWNERVFIRTGLSLSMEETGNEKLRIINFPAQLLYVFPGKKIQPRVGLGFNYWDILLEEQKELFYTTQISAGIDYNFIESMGLSLNFHSEFTPISTIVLSSNFELISYSVKFGVFYRF